MNTDQTRTNKMSTSRLSLSLINPCFMRGYFIFLLAAFAGCYQASKGSPEQKSETTKETPKVTSVTTVKPKRMTLQWTTQGPGYVQAYEQTPMYAKIAGYVKKWHVDIGDHVTEGKTLAELWIPEMEVELKQKE